MLAVMEVQDPFGELHSQQHLYVGLGALLIATRSTQSKVYGASSLFSSCLRRLPEYALQEQRDVKAEEPETLSDVPTELYEELHEIFGSASGGWKPLRMLVRWHAIALLREAILDNVIDFETVGRLIEICELEGAFAEQAQLQNAFLASTWPGDSEVSASIASCFRMHRRDVSYRQMTARLLDTGKPFRWISHNWILPLVHQAVTDVVHESTQVGSHAGSALVAAIMRSIGFCELKISPENRSEERPVKVSKKVRSKIDKDSSKQARRWLRGSEMVAYREDTVEVSTTGAFVELLADIVSGVLAVRGLSKARLTKTLVELEVVTRRAAMLYTRREEKYVQKRSELIRLSLLLLIMVMLPARSEHSSEVSQFSSSLELLSGMCIDPESELLMAKLLTTIASKTDQWTGKCDAFKHLDAMIQGLLKNASRSNDLTVKSMIHRVILDAAFQFADCSKMREHMDWALELEEYLDSVVSITRQLDSQTPLRHSHSRATGFRWKATLGEWVPKTPGSAKLQNTATRTSSTGAPGQQRIASDSTRESSVVSDVSTTPTSVKSPINRHPDHKCAEGFTKIPPHSVQIVIYRPANVSAGRRHSAPIFTSGSCKTSPVSSPAKAEKRKHESTSDVSYNQISRVISICIHSKDTVWEERDCVRQKHEEKDELACETTPASQRVSQIQRSSSTMGIPIKSDTIRQYNLRGRRSTEIVVKEFDMEIRDYCNRACQKLQMRPGQRSGINLPDEMIYDDNEYSEDELGF
ncbi:hypothetical protein MMC25_000672 [Agyrium rufum]|nr:hypothetical protein [Agyrium rufum]